MKLKIIIFLLFNCFYTFISLRSGITNLSKNSKPRKTDYFMKRTNVLALLSGLALTACLFVLNGCSDDPEPTTASFTYVATGRSVAFTSTSVNAQTFAWDFGDGSTSTEQNPTHVYAAYGKFTAKLATTGTGGGSTSLPDELTLAKTSTVVIDGNFADWANVADAIVSTDATSGTIKKVKVDYDATKIYFYVEGTSTLRGFFDIYLDTDNKPATGYFSGWYPEGFGADYLSEGDFHTVKDADIFKDQPGEVGLWGWDVTSATGTNAIKSSALATVGTGKGIEFSFNRAAFTNLAASGFSFAVVDVDGTVDPNATPTWAKLGSLPVDNTPTGKLKFFDLTK